MVSTPMRCDAARATWPAAEPAPMTGARTAARTSSSAGSAAQLMPISRQPRASSRRATATIFGTAIVSVASS
jgi:hypothetical protein